MHLIQRWIAVILGIVLLLGARALGQPALDSFDPAVNGTVRAIVVQPDRRIIIGGDFTTVGGSNCTRLARLHADGTVDATFNATATNSVYALALQSDGKILVGGNFPLLRLETNGTVDGAYLATNSLVRKIVVQPDGKAMLLPDRPRPLVRLNSNGSTATNLYWLPTNPTAEGFDFALQPDGKIILTGIAVVPTNAIRRFHPDGRRDHDFMSSAREVFIEYGYVGPLAIQPDERIICGGNFVELGGQIRHGFGRLNPDGSGDASFSPTNQHGLTKLIALQANGEIVTSRWGGPQINRIKPSGRLDTNFNFVADNVEVITVQPDGNILIGGTFTTVNGTNRHRMARILAGDSASPPPSPEMLRFSKHPGGIFRFDVTNIGELSASFDVLAATGLSQPWANWTSLGQPRSGTNGNHFEFTDLFAWTNGSPRFYRLRVDP